MKSASKTWIAANAVLGLLAAATPATAREQAIFVKPGVGAARMAGDDQSCVTQANKIQAPAPNATQSLNPVVIVSAPIIEALLGAYVQSNAQKKAENDCMEVLGYVKLKLTDEEADGFGRQRTPEERAAWLDTFLAKDLSSRLPPPLPSIPPLPTVPSEPFAIGAIRLDPTTLKANETSVAEGGVLATATASHRMTGQIKQGPDTIIHISAGRIFYYLESYHEDSGGHWVAQYWCGPFSSRSVPVCLQRQGPRHYTDTVGRGADWLISPIDGPDANDPDVQEGWFWIEPSPTDLLGPMDVTVEVATLRKDHIDVQILAGRGDKKVNVWKGRLAFDAQGQAVLKLWTRRLTISRTRDKVAVRLMADGDGQGPVAG